MDQYDLRQLLSASSNFHSQLETAVRNLQTPRHSQESETVAVPSTSSSGSRAGMRRHRSRSPILPTDGHGSNGGDPGPSTASHASYRGRRPPSRQAAVSSINAPMSLQQQGRSVNYPPWRAMGRTTRMPTKSLRAKPGNIPQWSHTFVCLSEIGQDRVPSFLERARLQISGLGEKKITMRSDGNAGDIHRQLISNYPKLSGGGGIELLRAQEGANKWLNVIEAPRSGYSVDFLKAVVHTAKIYIRPLQKNLPLDDDNDEDECVSDVFGVPKEKCLKCDRPFPVTILREHLIHCDRSNKHSSSAEHSPSIHISDESQYTPPSSRSSRSPPDSDPEDAAMQLAVYLSKSGNGLQDQDDDGSLNYDSTLSDAVSWLSSKLHPEDHHFNMVIRRSHVLADCFRRMDRSCFDPQTMLEVEFVGETGVDTGGPTREFFRLIKRDILKYLTVTGTFIVNSCAYQDNEFKKIGTLAGMCVTHGGGHMNMFSRSTYQYICEGSTENLNPSINEVSDVSTRELLQKLESSEDVEQLRRIATDKLDVLLECGFIKPPVTLQLQDKFVLTRSLILHKVVKCAIPELDHFRLGMSRVHGLLHVLKNYPNVLRPFYCNQDGIILTTETIKNLLTVQFSEVGTTERSVEEEAFMFFISYMDDCEGGVDVDESLFGEQGCHPDEKENHKVTLRKVLAFFTGAETIPPAGYTSATVNFNAENVFPTASTCAVVLTLPTKHKSYSIFKKYMDMGICLHGGYGLA